MINQEDLTCPKCEGHDLECTSCQNGIIPARTLKFINEKMFDEKGEYYSCQYIYTAHLYSPPIAEINFSISKDTFAIFGISMANYGFTDISNTVEFIDFMLIHHTQGKYQIERTYSSIIKLG